MIAIVVATGIAVAATVCVAVYTMVTMQRLRKPDHLRGVARKHSVSPLKLR